MTVLGGFRHFLGPVIGALAMTLLQDQLQSFTQYWRFLLGAILALVVIFLPGGLAGLACDAGARLGRRPAAPARPPCAHPMLDHCQPGQPARPGEKG